MRTPLDSLSKLADEVLAEVDAAEFTKKAEREIVKTASALPTTDLGQLLHKVAEAVLNDSGAEISYNDLNAFIGGRNG